MVEIRYGYSSVGWCIKTLCSPLQVFNITAFCCSAWCWCFSKLCDCSIYVKHACFIFYASPCTVNRFWWHFSIDVGLASATVD